MTLLAVDMGAVFEAWRRTPLDHLVAARPRGRLAALLAGPVEGLIVDAGRPAPAALAGASTESRRAFFDALAEDLALAAIHDAPLPIVDAVFAAIAGLAANSELLAATPAYPPELLEGPFVQDAASDTGLVTWISDPALATIAHAAARKVLELPPEAFPSAEPTLFHDLAEALLDVLAASTRVGHALLAQR